MYRFKNGILYRDHKPVFGLGVSYYGSFFPGKAPVADEKERIPEMRKDVERIRDFGFNIIRCGALGKVYYGGDGAVACETPFADAILAEAEKRGLAVMVRLQGYHTYLGGGDSFRMVDSTGRRVSAEEWNAFVQGSVHHPGVRKDNQAAAEALARHFSQFPSFVSFCTYNEPHYPGGGLYDYHPDTIRAYQLWLRKNGFPAQAAQPPRNRPGHDAREIADWVSWRRFSQESLSGFLAEAHIAAKRQAPTAEGTTAAVPVTYLQGNDAMGVDNFAYARDMDFCGFTSYTPVVGGGYFQAACMFDFMESCAAVCHKHTWLLEYDARTQISPEKFEKETYLALGSGMKGIMYYQWRGDYPNGATEEDDAFGILHYDGTPANAYAAQKKMIRMINQYSDYLVGAERVRSGLAILHSDAMHFFQCAYQKDGAYVENPYTASLTAIHRALTQRGVPVEFVKAEHLADSAVRGVIIPEYDYMLAPDERQKLQAYIQAGGQVFCYSGGRYAPFSSAPASILRENNDLELMEADILERLDIHPAMTAGLEYIQCRVLRGDGYYLAAVINIRTDHRAAGPVEIRCGFRFQRARLITPEREEALTAEGNTIIIPKIQNGGLIIFTE